MRKFRVLLYETMHDAGIQKLREEAEIVFASSLDEGALISQVKGVDAIIIRANGRVTKKIVEAAPKLKVVGRHGVGVENIDVEEATRRGIQVVNTPEANSESVAEHVVGMMIALSKRILEGDRSLRYGDWNARYKYFGAEMRGKNVGIVGFGRIGRRVGEICRRGFDMRVLYNDKIHNQWAEAELGAKFLPMDELLRESDYISLNVPLTPETHHLIGERELGLMKREAYLINASRGPVVDESALVRALKEGGIAGAGIDVFEAEPTPKDNPLLTLPNVIATPHMAANTREAMERMAVEVASDIIKVLKGEKPQYPVNRV
ncbi:MAG: hydroxyacid dehydrogenase [bacterium]